MDILNKVDAKKCARCGGKCCKFYAATTHPDQWGAPNKAVMVEQLTAAFKAGFYAIDWWDGYLEGFDSPEFVRPAHKGVDSLHDPAWNGECVFLKSDGCTLEHDARPYGCMALDPSTCFTKDEPTRVWSKREGALAWAPYQAEIAAAAEASGRKGEKGTCLDTLPSTLRAVTELVGMLHAIGAKEDKDEG